MAQIGKLTFRFYPTPGVLFIAYYASDSIIFDFQIINQNHWEYEDHWRWIKRAYADYLPKIEYDPSIPF